MNIFKRLWRRIFPRQPDLELSFVEGDTPPENLSPGHFVVAREGDELWAAALLCPCGCGERIELALIEEATTKWRLVSEERLSPTLHPSVWRKTGCRSHFWIRGGMIVWCKD